ncbi:MAG: hypothetical protein AB4063_04640 [Crocosphaera sp.]
MMVRRLIVTLLISGLNLFTLGIPVQADVIQKYNEFTGKTSVMVTPGENWDGQSPHLWVIRSFKGQKNEEVPSLIFFSVIIPKDNYYPCSSGITGVIADGERVITADEIDDQSIIGGGMKNWRKTQDAGDINPRLEDYLKIWGRYEPKEFLQIAQAQTVRYQICGEQVYELSPQELQDLKEFTKIVLNSDVLEKINQ